MEDNERLLLAQRFFGKPHSGEVKGSEIELLGIPGPEQELAVIYEYGRESATIRELVKCYRHDNTPSLAIGSDVPVCVWPKNFEKIAWFLTYLREFPRTPWLDLNTRSRLESVTAYQTWKRIQHQFDLKRSTGFSPISFEPITLLTPQDDHFNQAGELLSYWFELSKREPEKFCAAAFLVDKSVGRGELRRRLDDLVSKMTLPGKPTGRNSPMDALRQLAAMRLRYHAQTLPQAIKLAKGSIPGKDRSTWRKTIEGARSSFADHFHLTEELLRWTPKWGYFLSPRGR